MHSCAVAHSKNPMVGRANEMFTIRAGRVGFIARELSCIKKHWIIDLVQPGMLPGCAVHLSIMFKVQMRKIATFRHERFTVTSFVGHGNKSSADRVDDSDVVFSEIINIRLTMIERLRNQTLNRIDVRQAFSVKQTKTSEHLKILHLTTNVYRRTASAGGGRTVPRAAQVGLVRYKTINGRLQSCDRACGTEVYISSSGIAEFAVITLPISHVQRRFYRLIEELGVTLTKPTKLRNLSYVLHCVTLIVFIRKYAC
ncbi:hypothetical protein ANN_05205 [Periplaneta americana]|uniref:Uncharacterized protein n=1 Tax=Periplaneta americana TaxID=6978 RepID=A0ABQ8TAH3_PERAM|nr:hypothetical protein ANN_05205 [Periplaneta americana]